MKRIPMRLLFLMVIVIFSTMAVRSQNALRNGGFEAFSNGEPGNWTTSNISGILVLVSPSKEAHSGKSGIKLEVKSFYGTKMAGTATQENISITARQALLRGFYTLKSVGGDKAFVNVSLINDNGSTVCSENLNLESTTSFTQFSLAVNAPEGSTVVKAKVCIAIMGGNNDQLHEGTTAIFDDCVLAPQIE
jgi:hypothetical protein